MAESEATKICKSCATELPLHCFAKSKMTKDGYENVCKECRKRARFKYSNICVTCGKAFQSRQLNTKYCGNACKPQCMSRHVFVKCSVCGKLKSVKSGYATQHEDFYCSKQCGSIGNCQKLKGENNPKYNRQPVVCEVCDKEFSRTPSQIQKYAHRFCSHTCQAQAYRKLFKGENNPLFGKERHDMRGDKNWSWNPERTAEQRKKERKEGVNKNWRRDVFLKFNYTCQYCGKRGNGDIIAHHIDSYDWCIDKRYDVDNGIVLCEDCHKRFHKAYGYGGNTKEQLEEFLSGREK